MVAAPKVSRRTWRYALILTLPTMFSYIFVGIAYGVVLQQAGYGWPWALFSSAVIVSGAFQFVLVPMLTAGTTLLTVAVTALFVGCRLLFYGLATVDSFRKLPRLRPLLIHGLTDESFALFTTMNPGPGVDRQQVMCIVTFGNVLYWIFGSLLGGLIGQALPVDLAGVEFCMTALFTTIVLDQWRRRPDRLPVAVGMALALLFLLLLGPEAFLLPALAGAALCLSLGRRVLAKRLAEGERE